MFRKPFSSSSLVLAALLCSGHLHAANFCVGSVDELRSALAESAGNGQDDFVIVRPGRYLIDQTLAVTITDNKSLGLIGDEWICGDHIVDPTHTVLDGQNSTPILSLNHRGAGNLIVNGLTFRNGRGSNQPVVAVFGSCGSSSCWSGGMMIEGNHFVDNVNAATSGSVAAIYLGSADPGNAHQQVRVANNAFENNAAYGTPIQIGVDNGWTDAGHVYHNTFYNNWSTLPGSANIGGLRLLGTGAWKVFNNNFWGNSGYDLEVDADVSLRYNNIQSWVGLPGINAHNLSTNPHFVPGQLRLRATSPLIDAGTTIPEQWGGNGFSDGWGGERLYGGGP